MLLCACRIGFDTLNTGDAGDAGTSETVTFGERPASQRKNVTTDATLDQSMASANFGGAEDLSIAEFVANGEHGLLRFDLSSIAPGTPVLAARLHLVRRDYGDEAPGSIELRLLAESWVEGTNMGMPGTGATWTTRDGATAWTTPGGTTTQVITTATPTAAEVVFALDPSVVQGWIDAPATNFGVLATVAVNTAHYHFYTRDSPLDMTARPELALDLVQ